MANTWSQRLVEDLFSKIITNILLEREGHLLQYRPKSYGCFFFISMMFGVWGALICDLIFWKTRLPPISEYKQREPIGIFPVDSAPYNLCGRTKSNLMKILTNYDLKTSDMT